MKNFFEKKHKRGTQEILKNENQPANENEKNFKNYFASFFILVGLLLILISIICEEGISTPHYWVKIFFILLGHLGMGGLLLGILNILLDTGHWEKYFKDRLVEIVMEKSYLQNLKAESLTNLQMEVLQAYFKDSNIAGADGFLKHYEVHIQQLIGDPFRVNVENDFRIEYSNNSKSELLVHEQISWICKSNGGNIQKEIRWIPDENEFISITHRSIKLLLRSAEEFDKELKYEELKNEWKIPRCGGFRIPLAELFTKSVNLDGLKILVSVSYVIPKQRFIASRMAHPSRGFTMTIRYPDDLNIRKEIYCVATESFQVVNEDRGYFKIRTEGWVLPEEGIAFQLQMEANQSQKHIPSEKEQSAGAKKFSDS